MRFKIEDVALWIFLLAALAIIIWLLHGSPTLEQALVSLVVLLLSSEFLLWKKYYEVDKSTAVAFTTVKNDIQNLSKEIGRNHQEIKLSIEKLSWRK